MPQTTRNFVSTHRFVEIILILYTLIGLFVIVYALKELASFITEKLCKSEAKRTTNDSVSAIMLHRVPIVLPDVTPIQSNVYQFGTFRP